MTSANQPPFDVYGNTDKLEKPVLDVIVKRLEARGQHPSFDNIMQEYFAAMQIDQAQTVLEVGCGTGVVARAIAKRPHFKGRITGIDLSDHLVDNARQLAIQDGMGEQIEFRVGDIRSLNLLDDSFDAVIAHTLISHVDQPQKAISQMARVVKPGGWVAIFDGDYASMTFGNPDPERGRKIDELIIGGLVTQPHVMRQMPRLLKAAGLELSSAFAYVISDMGQANFWMSAIESFHKLLPASGVMTKQEATAWLDDLVKDSENGVFFGSSNYITYVARKP